MDCTSQISSTNYHYLNTQVLDAAETRGNSCLVYGGQDNPSDVNAVLPATWNALYFSD